MSVSTQMERFSILWTSTFTLHIVEILASKAAEYEDGRIDSVVDPSRVHAH